MKVAIVGAGISGLTAAYTLNLAGHEVCLYEQNAYLGGHSRTIEIKINNQRIAVDTGFIVFNYLNYPNLTSLFKHLGVVVEKSDMSFGVSIANGWLEYSTQTMSNIFTQKINYFRPQFWGMLYDILKFNNNAKKYIESNLTIGECLKELNLGAWFKSYYLLAMGGAIWSTPMENMLEFPAQIFIRFFDNHGLLAVNGQPQWYTVTGGSQEYVKKLSAPFIQKIRTSCGVNKVKRENNRIIVHDELGYSEHFDQIIFACHADQAIKLLDIPTEEELNIIGNIKYQANSIIVHSDESFMPKHKKAWASWVYLSENRQDKSDAISLSYWMNRLQNIHSIKPIIITLNPNRMPKRDLVYDEYQFTHPVFDQAAILAQTKIDALQGKNHTWYCGAYLKYGFHEDGVTSAIRVMQKLGVSIPWH